MCIRDSPKSPGRVGEQLTSNLNVYVRVCVCVRMANPNIKVRKNSAKNPQEMNIFRIKGLMTLHDKLAFLSPKPQRLAGELDL